MPEYIPFMLLHRAPLICLLAFGAAAHADGGDRRSMVDGPVEAELVSVIDGDTLLVNARPWPQHTIAVLVRIRGIDAPEIRSKCSLTRLAAERAKQALVELAPRRLLLTHISGDKFFGRVVADVAAPDETDFGTQLLASGLVRAYGGGRRTQDSC